MPKIPSSYKVGIICRQVIINYRRDSTPPWPVDHHVPWVFGYGDLNDMHDIADAMGYKGHPLIKMNTVLSAMTRHCQRPDSLFDPLYFRATRGLARMFEVKPAYRHYDCVLDSKYLTTEQDYTEVIGRLMR